MKITAIALTLLFSIMNIIDASRLYAQGQVIEKISTVDSAKKIASMADGEYREASQYWENPPSPAVEGTEKIALPVQDEDTGKVLGYIVAEKEKLIAALEASGLTDAANALAAVEAGEIAGGATAAGIFSGTTAKVVLGIAVIAGVALAAGGGGGSGGGTTTTIHH